jgi:hypothetical protein
MLMDNYGLQSTCTAPTPRSRGPMYMKQSGTPCTATPRYGNGCVFRSAQLYASMRWSASDVKEACQGSAHVFIKPFLARPQPKSDYDEWAPAESASAPVAQAAAPVSPSQSRNLAAKPTVNMVRSRLV